MQRDKGWWASRSLIVLASLSTGVITYACEGRRPEVEPPQEAATVEVTPETTISVTSDDKRDTVAISVAATFASVSAGGSHTCGVTTAGKAYCWGYNNRGQLGNGTMEGATEPAAVSGDLVFASVDAGAWHTCGVTKDGAAYCWGSGSSGRLGHGDTTGSPIPVPVAGGLTFRSVSADGEHSCGVTTSGVGYCWGVDDPGGSDTGSTVPVAVAGELTFQTLSVGMYHACGVSTSGAGYCWGFNMYGQIGVGSPADPMFLAGDTGPAPVAGELEFTVVSAGGQHSCGVTTDGDVYCWGYDLERQAGTDSEDCGEGEPCVWTPGLVRGGFKFQSVSAGRAHTCGVTTDGDAYCWGADYDDASPVAEGLTFQSVSAGGQHTCGVTSSGVAYCWGWNSYGQLGDGKTAQGVVAPVRVGGEP